MDVHDDSATVFLTDCGKPTRRGGRGELFVVGVASSVGEKRVGRRNRREENINDDIMRRVQQAKCLEITCWSVSACVYS